MSQATAEQEQAEQLIECFFQVALKIGKSPDFCYVDDGLVDIIHICKHTNEHVHKHVYCFQIWLRKSGFSLRKEVNNLQKGVLSPIVTQN